PRRPGAAASPYPTGDDEHEGRHLLGHQQRRISDQPRIKGAENAGPARTRSRELVTREPVGKHRQDSTDDGVEDGGDMRPRAENQIDCCEQTAVADRPMAPRMPAIDTVRVAEAGGDAASSLVV